MAKKCFKNKCIIFLTIFILLLTQVCVTAVSARAADVSSPASGNMLVGVSGTFGYTAKSTILNRINAIRREACEKRYRDPSTGKRLTSADYVPIKWSSSLEWIAQLRAAECTVYESHTRPNGGSCISIEYQKDHSWGECLAWNYQGLMAAIEQWYGEKKDWVRNNTNAVTGHYTSLIDPRYRYIGLGSFRRDTGGWYGVAAEFGYSNSGTQTKSKLKGKTLQMIEVPKRCIGDKKISAPSSIKVKNKKALSISCSIRYPGIMGGMNLTQGIIKKDITWGSSRPSVLSVSTTGTITAKKAGKATITAKVKGGFTVKKTITVKR